MGGDWRQAYQHIASLSVWNLLSGKQERLDLIVEVAAVALVPREEVAPLHHVGGAGRGLRACRGGRWMERSIELLMRLRRSLKVQCFF